MSTLNPREIVTLSIEVRYLTEAVSKMIQDMEKHRSVLESKGSAEDVQKLREDMILLTERLFVLQEGYERACKKHYSVETRVKQLEFQAWKLGLILGGSATGGSIFTLVAQYLLGLF